ncbi:hypothetical protein EZJ43_02185 [Pedobacter changchengzhani]|uniref:Uncharacterized protein n=1 Tax=Pedobacter changchengzhani TaxID=2529274 RepID=A0A4R5MQ31_9SPHI|nr:hypothetical protein [Pedobacter changchengzhani]TDG37921.1 hypothetical protein EZJ43_02185 [Pedobacter changchengzhani]
MRQLKPKTHIHPKDLDLDELIKIASAKELSYEEEKELFDQIKNGDNSKIEKLIASEELMILKLIKMLGVTKEQQVSCTEKAKISLSKLLKREINSELSPKYFKFRAWVVRQGILENLKSS